ncbi:MAG TPA: hypothetical protein VF209_00395 [Patescibacteria group bacterium]
MAQPSGPTLTDVTQVGRKTVLVAGVLLVVMIVGRFFLTSFIAFWKAINPPPPPPPTVGFGILPALVFPPEYAQAKPQAYELETPTGGFPTFPDRAKVFLVKQPALSLLSDERARKIAAEYDFIFEPEVIGATTYRWRRSQPLEAVLEMNIETLQFSLATDYLSRPELLTGESIDNFEAVSRVKSLLRKADLLGSDVATAAGEVSYLKVLGGETVPAVSLSDADIIQVDLNRGPIDGQYRMFTPEGLIGTVRALVLTSLKGDESIVELDYNYREVEYTQVHTYPLRSAQQAWQLLNGGEGYIASPSESETAVVRDVILAYFDAYDPQDYLQPIYVFMGDDGFLGYVPAIDPRYLQTTPLVE